MRNYEAMFIVKPDLTEEDRKTLFAQLGEVITKHTGKVAQAAVWAEKRKLFFPLKKQHEGIYYLMQFSAEPNSIATIREAYRINESVLRVLITSQEA